MFIYLDESGDLSRNGSKCFVVGSYTIGDSKRLVKAFRKWQKAKFPRRLKSQSEIKFNDPHLSDNDRLKFLKYLCDQDIRIAYCFLKKENIPSDYFKKGLLHKAGLLYTEIVVSTLELYLPLTEHEFRVFRDQRFLKALTRGEFNKILETRLLPKLPTKTIVQIEAVDSTGSAMIQVADWVCGAMARFHEGKTYGQEFYDVLKKNIVAEKELFSDFWTKKWK